MNFLSNFKAISPRELLEDGGVDLFDEESVVVSSDSLRLKLQRLRVL